MSSCASGYTSTRVGGLQAAYQCRWWYMSHKYDCAVYGMCVCAAAVPLGCLNVLSCPAALVAPPDSMTHT